MLNTLRNQSSLLAGIGLVGVANALLSTIISMRMAVEGFSALSIGVVLAGYNVGFTFGATSIARLVSRVGHIRAFTAFSAVTGAAVVLLPLLLHPAAWLPLRALAGYAMAGMYMVVESWLNARAQDVENGGGRGLILAAYMLIMQFSMGAGQIWVMAFAPDEIEPFLVVTAIYAFAVVPIALTRIGQPPMPSSTHMGLRKLARIAPLGIVGGTIAGIVTTALLTLGPLYVLARGFDTSDVALFMGVAIASGLLLQWPVGRISDRIGRRMPLFSVCTILAGVTALLALWEPASLSLLLIFAGVSGALMYLVYPLSLAYLNDRVEPEESIAAGGTLLLCFGTGAMLSPLAGTLAMDTLGADGLFLWIAAASSILALGTLYRIFFKGVSIPPDERHDFVPVSLPRAAPAGQLVDE